MSGSLDPTIGANISGGGNLLQTPLLGKVIDPWGAMRNYSAGIASTFAPAQAQANVGLTQAQTGETTARAGLLGQQATGQSIENVIKSLPLPSQSAIWQKINQQLSGQAGGSSYREALSPENGGGGGSPAMAPWVPNTEGGGSGPPAPAGPPTPAIGSGRKVAPAPAPTQEVQYSAPAGAQLDDRGNYYDPKTQQWLPLNKVPPSDVASLGKASSGEVVPGVTKGPNMPAAPPGSVTTASKGGPSLPSIGLYGTESEPANPNDVQQQPAIGSGRPAGSPPVPAPQARPQLQSGPNGTPPITTGGGGIMMPGVPFAMPTLIASGYMQAQDKAAYAQQALQNIKAIQAQRILSIMDPKTGQPVSREAWNQEVGQAYDDGLITSVELNRFYNKPDQAQRVLIGLGGATGQPWFEGGVAGSKAANEAGPRIAEQQAAPQKINPGETVRVPPNPYGPQGGNQGQPQQNAASSIGYDPADARNAAALSSIQDPEMRRWVVASAASNNVPVAALVATLQQESGANRNAPRGSSGEYGPGQIMPATGREMGYSEQQLADPRTNVWAAGQYLRKMIDDSGQQGGNPETIVTRAGGMYNHPAGALQGYTQSWQQHYRGFGAQPPAEQPQQSPVQPAGGAGGAGGAAPPGGAASPPGGTSPVTVTTNPDGSTTVVPNTTPGDIESQRQTAQSVVEYKKDQVTKADAAQQANASVDQLRLHSQTWASGWGAETKADAQRIWDGLRAQVNAAAGKDILGAPSQSLGDYQDTMKTFGQLARTAQQALSPRGSFQEFQTVLAQLPGPNMSDQGKRMVFDQMQGMNDWAIAKSQASGRLDGRVAPNEFDSQWANNVSPEAFIVRRMSPADFDTFRQQMSKSPEGRTELRNIGAQMAKLASWGYLPNPQQIPTGPQQQ